MINMYLRLREVIKEQKSLKDSGSDENDKVSQTAALEEEFYTILQNLVNWLNKLQQRINLASVRDIFNEVSERFETVCKGDNFDKTKLLLDYLAVFVNNFYENEKVDNVKVNLRICNQNFTLNSLPIGAK